MPGTVISFFFSLFVRTHWTIFTVSYSIFKVTPTCVTQIMTSEWFFADTTIIDGSLSTVEKHFSPCYHHLPVAIITYLEKQIILKKLHSIECWAPMVLVITNISQIHTDSIVQWWTSEIEIRQNLSSYCWDHLKINETIIF